MKVINFVTQKGGSGKSCLAINCAVAATQKRKRVFLLDMDEQRTAENWFQARESDFPRLAHIEASELAKALEIADKQKFDYVLIDTPGRDEPAQASAIRLSDFCVIPCRPSPADLQAVKPTVDVVRRLEKPFAFVLTQTPARSFRTGEAAAALSKLGDVCPVPVVTRNAYQDAQGAGFGVVEYEPKGRAADETTRLWQWISKKVK